MITPERSLWCAVLAQAYDDAEGLLTVDGKALEPIDCARARRYLRADSTEEMQDLALVCEFANVPPDRIFLWARQRYPLAA